MENFPGYQGNTWKIFHLSTLIGGPRAKARLAFGHPPIGLRDEPIEFDRRRSRSAYQTQSSRPPAGVAALGRLAR